MVHREGLAHLLVEHQLSAYANSPPKSPKPDDREEPLKTHPKTPEPPRVPKSPLEENPQSPLSPLESTEIHGVDDTLKRPGPCRQICVCSSARMRCRARRLHTPRAASNLLLVSRE